MLETTSPPAAEVAKGQAILVPTSALGHLLVPFLLSELGAAGWAVDAVDDATDTPRELAILLVEADEDVDVLVAERRDRGLSTLVVAQQHPDVRVGPLDVPGTELCARCFDVRDRQWGTHPAPRLRSGADSVDVDGFPPYALAMVANVVVDRVQSVLGRGLPSHNEVCFVSTATLLVHSSTVAPVNGCERCESDEAVVPTLGDLALHR